MQFETGTLIFYEAPHKLINTLKAIYDQFGERKCCLAREITKIHEEFIRDDLKNIINKEIDPKGEYVILIEGSNKTKDEINIEKLNAKTIEEHYQFYLSKGMEKKEIIKKIAKDRNISKNEVYQKFINQS